jgi:hypothetical protein
MVSNIGKLYLIFVVLLSAFLYFGTSNVFGAVSVQVTGFPDSITAVQEFEVSFIATGLDAASSYNAKGLGGSGFNQVDTLNADWLQQNRAWDLFPSFTPNDEGTSSGKIKVRFDPATAGGAQPFKIRIKEGDDTYNSPDVSINVTAVTPVPTPTPTIAPTPIQTATPAATSLASKPPTTKPTTKPSVIPTAGGEPEVLGEEIESSPLSPRIPEPTPAVKKSTEKKDLPLLALILIGTGIIFVVFSGFMIVRNIRKTKASDDILTQ